MATHKVDSTPIPFRIELPPFIKDEVNLWWAQVVARLNLANITDDRSKFRYVVAALPAEVVKRVPDLIYTEPATNPFETLHLRIVKEFEPTDSAKLRELLEGCNLGDKTPSELLREMRRLAQGRLTDDALRELFFKRLPKSLTTISITTGVTDLEKAAEAADNVLKSPYPCGLPSTLAAMTSTQHSVPQIMPQPTTINTTTDTSFSPSISAMAAQIESLARSVQKLTEFTHDNRRSREQRSPSRNRDPRTRSQTPSRRYDHCYYHYKFGDAARNCRTWCKRYQDHVSKNKTPEN